MTSLLNLPTELIIKIGKFTPLSDCRRLSTAHRDLRGILAEQVFQSLHLRPTIKAKVPRAIVPHVREITMYLEPNGRLRFLRTISFYVDVLKQILAAEYPPKIRCVTFRLIPTPTATIVKLSKRQIIELSSVKHIFQILNLLAPSEVAIRHQQFLIPYASQWACELLNHLMTGTISLPSIQDITLECACLAAPMFQFQDIIVQSHPIEELRISKCFHISPILPPDVINVSHLHIEGSICNSIQIDRLMRLCCKSIKKVTLDSVRASCKLSQGRCMAPNLTQLEINSIDDEVEERDIIDILYYFLYCPIQDLITFADHEKNRQGMRREIDVTLSTICMQMKEYQGWRQLKNFVLHRDANQENMTRMCLLDIKDMKAMRKMDFWKKDVGGGQTQIFL